jgi:hypothetical protein
MSRERSIEAQGSGPWQLTCRSLFLRARAAIRAGRSAAAANIGKRGGRQRRWRLRCDPLPRSAVVKNDEPIRRIGGALVPKLGPEVPRLIDPAPRRLPGLVDEMEFPRALRDVRLSRASAILHALILADQKENFLCGSRGHADGSQSRDNRQRFHVTLSCTKPRRDRYSKACVARVASADGFIADQLGSFDQRGREAAAAVKPGSARSTIEIRWRALRESNPCFRRERAASWTARRRAQSHARTRRATRRGDIKSFAAGGK